MMLRLPEEQEKRRRCNHLKPVDFFATGADGAPRSSAATLR
jgi:hypothetical protein